MFLSVQGGVEIKNTRAGVFAPVPVPVMEHFKLTSKILAPMTIQLELKSVVVGHLARIPVNIKHIHLTTACIRLIFKNWIINVTRTLG